MCKDILVAKLCDENVFAYVCLCSKFLLCLFIVQYVFFNYLISVDVICNRVGGRSLGVSGADAEISARKYSCIECTFTFTLNIKCPIFSECFEMFEKSWQCLKILKVFFFFFFFLNRRFSTLFDTKQIFIK